MICSKLIGSLYGYDTVSHRFILVGIEMVIPGFNAPVFWERPVYWLAIFMVSDSFDEGAIITIIV